MVSVSVPISSNFMASKDASHGSISTLAGSISTVADCEPCDDLGRLDEPDHSNCGVPEAALPAPVSPATRTLRMALCQCVAATVNPIKQEPLHCGCSLTSICTECSQLSSKPSNVRFAASAEVIEIGSTRWCFVPPKRIRWRLGPARPVFFDGFRQS